jgi:hypothetical protein
MGISYQIEAGNTVYTVVDDLSSAYSVIFACALVDETTGNPITSVPVLTVDLPGVRVRLSNGALISGAAYVENVFPDLATQAYTIHIAILTPGYRDASLTVNVPIAAAFPVAVAPLILRRIPTRLQGRVVKASDRSPIAAAAVGAKDNKMLLLRTPVRSAHGSGVVVNSLSFANTGPARKLIADVRPGEDRIVLDNDAGLGPGDHLQIGSLPNAEIYEISAVGPDPGLVVLKNKLAASFAATTAAQTATASAASGTAILARSSDAGDGVLLVNTPLNDMAVEIVDGAFTEYCFLSSISDDAGYYRANGIAGVRRLDLRCSAAGFNTADQPWFPQYSTPVNIVDFRLTP